MKREDWILLLVIASLLGSAFGMKKFSLDTLGRVLTKTTTTTLRKMKDLVKQS